jgi:2-amino-4-hydroxy-6-hydroxymethyldihydropteridine diphosphokinase
VIDMVHDAAAIIALGGNQGDVVAHFAAAVKGLREQGCIIKVLSSLYHTPAWGKTDQPDFLNMTLELRSSLRPHDLLHLCLAIETQHGRQRHLKWGPRTLDLDIIDYDGLIMRDDNLTLPHPHTLERAFVLVPLCEIRPHMQIGGHDIASVLAQIEHSDIRRDDMATERFLTLLNQSSTS